MSPRRPAPTIRDVAARAGVSVRTVSRLLSGQPVSAPTQLRIEAVMQELEYVPSAAARALRGQAQRVLGVLVEGTSPGSSGASLLQGIHEVASEQGVLVLRAESDGSPEHLEEVQSAFLAQRVEAIVRVSPVLGAVSPGRALRSVPVVLANAESASFRGATVLSDPVGAARTATEALLDLGHTRVGLALPVVGSHVSAHCETGYRAALEGRPQSAVPEGFSVAVPVGDASPGSPSGNELWRLVSGPEPVSALVCVGLDVGLQVFSRLVGRGVAVPGEVSLVCVTPDRDAGAALHPSLAVVSLDHRALGRRSASLALSGGGAGVERVPSHLVLRRSVRSRRL